MHTHCESEVTQSEQAPVATGYIKAATELFARSKHWRLQICHCSQTGESARHTVLTEEALAPSDRTTSYEKAGEVRSNRKAAATLRPVISCESRLREEAVLGNASGSNFTQRSGHPLRPIS